MKSLYADVAASLVVGFIAGLGWDRAEVRAAKQRASLYRSALRQALADSLIWQGTHALAVEHMRAERASAADALIAATRTET